MWYIRAWGGSPVPVAVDFQHSQFTMVVMSYEARLITLKVPQALWEAVSRRSPAGTTYLPAAG